MIITAIKPVTNTIHRSPKFFTVDQCFLILFITYSSGATWICQDFCCCDEISEYKIIRSRKDIMCPPDPNSHYFGIWLNWTMTRKSIRTKKEREKKRYMEKRGRMVKVGEVGMEGEGEKVCLCSLLPYQLVPVDIQHCGWRWTLFKFGLFPQLLINSGCFHPCLYRHYQSMLSIFVYLCSSLYVFFGKMSVLVHCLLSF